MGYTIQWIKGGGYPKNLNTETESLGEVQVFGMYECRTMGCTIQWIKGGGYPKNLNTETESLGEVQDSDFGMHEVQGDGMHNSMGVP